MNNNRIRYKQRDFNLNDIEELNKTLVKNLQDVLAMYDSGVKLLFAEVKKIRHIMEQELQL